MHILLRKSPLHRNHFFEWLKTTVLLFDCGTSTLKSLLLLGSDAPHVHLRLRKRFSRCTLDCGFKTSESPALRGFVAGPWALATAALYLVLKSNGLRRPKIRLKKFSFSLKIVPAYISKKLPSQCWPKPLFIPFFNFSHKRPTFAFTGKIGTHSPSPTGLHTRAYTAKQRAFRMGRYHYPRTVSHVSETLRGRVSERRTLPLLSLGRVYARRTQRASEQRCAYACRCSEASRPRWAA